MVGTELNINQKFKSLLPEMTAEEIEALRKSLKTLTDKRPVPVVYEWDGNIVDGHYVYEICREEGLDYEIQPMEFASEDEVILWIIQTHLARRHLNPAQRIKLALKYKEYYRDYRDKQKAGPKPETDTGNGGGGQSDPKEPDENEDENENNDDPEKKTKAKKPKLGENGEPEKKQTQRKKVEIDEEIAKIAGVGRENVRKCKKVLDSENETLIAQMLSGEKSIHAAYEEVMRAKRKAASFEVIYDRERIQMKCNDYLDELRKLTEKHIVYKETGEIAETLGNDIKDLIELVTDIQEKLDQMEETKEGIIEINDLRRSA